MKRIEEIVKKSAMKFGLIAVEVEVKKSSVNAVLYSKTHNVNIGELEKATRKIQEELDNAGLGNLYTVSLSSPGMDRVLKSEEEITIFSGRFVKVSSLENDKIIVSKGVLMGIKNGNVAIRTEKDEKEISLGKVTSIQLWDKLFEKGGNKK